MHSQRIAESLLKTSAECVIYVRYLRKVFANDN